MGGKIFKVIAIAIYAIMQLPIKILAYSVAAIDNMIAEMKRHTKRYRAYQNTLNYIRKH